VWLEPVPDTYVEGVVVQPEIDNNAIMVTVRLKGKPYGNEHVHVRIDGGEAGMFEGDGMPQVLFQVAFPIFALWSPDSPTLYNVSVSLWQGSTILDTVVCSVAMRKVTVEKAQYGNTRIHVNGKPLFQMGVLDQGWWPDGLYTAPSDSALRNDIELVKQLGFNVIRKHVKVEPARWYHWADRIGVLIWQDMPSAQSVKKDAERRQWLKEWKSIIDSLRSYQSIIAWVPFNEQWGQHDASEVITWTQRYDPSRLVDGPSGWSDVGIGDMLDRHDYHGPGMTYPWPWQSYRAPVLGEFGGLGYPAAGHVWHETASNWAQLRVKNREELTTRYQKFTHALPPLIVCGLAAAIYTQLTDVESEVDGLVTYDRRMLKVEPQVLKRLHKQVLARAAETASEARLATQLACKVQVVLHAFEYCPNAPQKSAAVCKVGVLLTYSTCLGALFAICTALGLGCRRDRVQQGDPNDSRPEGGRLKYKRLIQ